MDCPVCKEAMAVLEWEAVEVDFCPACQGIWLDGGELELLYGDEEACAAFLSEGDASKAPREKARRCPMCRKKMEKGHTGGKAPVTYDRCPRGHGLWFDQGELQEILKHSATFGDSGRMAAFLGEVFGASEDENKASGGSDK